MGNGASSVVIKAFDTKKERMVAIKKIKHVFFNTDTAKRALRELRIQRSLRNHPVCLNIKDVYVEQNGALEFKSLYVVTEIMSIDLHDFSHAYDLTKS